MEHKNTDFGIEVIDNMIIVKVTPNLEGLFLILKQTIFIKN